MKSSASLKSHAFFRASFRRVTLAMIVALGISGGASLADESEIASVQRALVELRLLAGTPSGVLDETTRDALRSFQASHGLAATGKIDRRTRALLQNREPVSVPVQPREAVEKALVANTFELDRDFLRELERTEQRPGPSVQIPTAAPAVVAPVAKAPERVSPAVRDSESDSRFEVSDRRTVVVDPRTRRVTGDDDADPLGSHGTRVIRTTTTATTADGRTFIVEPDSDAQSGVAVIEVRRAEAVRSR